MPKRPIGNIQYLGDNKYFLRFSAGYNDYGKRIQLSKTVICKNEREAEKELMKFFAEKDDLLSEKMTKAPERLSDLYKEWMKNHVDRQLKPRTKEYYESLWKRYVKEKGGIHLKSIKTKNIFDILDGVNGKKIKTERTRQSVYKMLNAIMNKAVEWGYIENNPCNRVQSPKYKSKEKNVYSKETLNELFKALEKEPVKYRAITYFAVLCGLRRQEIIGLKWSDINFSKNEFEIKRAAVDLKGVGTFTDETKTLSSVRKLALPKLLFALLKEHKKQQAQKRLKLGEKWSCEDDWVFTQWNGQIMSVDTPTGWWIKFIDKNDFPSITFHDLRHTAASYLINSGVDIGTVSSILGHAQKSTTLNIYTHVIADAKAQAIATLENTFFEDTL